MLSVDMNENDDSEPVVRMIDVAKARIEPLFPGLSFERAGGAVPFQATGTYLGYAQFYFRFRSDCASLTIGRPARHVPESDYVTFRNSVTGDDYAGFLDEDEFVALFVELMQKMYLETSLPR